MRKIEFQNDIFLILDRLKEGKNEFVSGEELGKRCRISRTALWKKINYLRGLGYQIGGHRSRGYKLIFVPDIPYPWEIFIPHNSIWKNIIYYNIIESTNTEARVLAEGGAVHGTVVIAESQSKGRGRLGRIWYSPPSGNIYISLILRPEIPPFLAPQFTLAAGVGVAETVEEMAGIKPEIKWPNDLLIDNRKFCGILTELNSEMDRLNFIIVGIGINLNSDIPDYPAQIRNEITTLKVSAQRCFNRNEFIKRLLKNLEQNFFALTEKGFRSIKTKWEKYFCMKDENVVISSQMKSLHGRAIGIDDSGAFLLRLASGRVERILSGDVSRLRRG